MQRDDRGRAVEVQRQLAARGQAGGRRRSRARGSPPASRSRPPTCPARSACSCPSRGGAGPSRHRCRTASRRRTGPAWRARAAATGCAARPGSHGATVIDARPSSSGTVSIVATIRRRRCRPGGAAGSVVSSPGATISRSRVSGAASCAAGGWRVIHHQARVVAGGLDRGQDLLDRYLGPGDDGRPLGRQVDIGNLDAVDLAQVALDPVDARRAGHALDIEREGGRTRPRSSSHRGRVRRVEVLARVLVESSLQPRPQKSTRCLRKWTEGL